MGVGDLLNAIQQVFSAADIIRLTLIVMILLLAGFMMPSFRSILKATPFALVTFAVLLYLRSLVTTDGNAIALAKERWHDLLALDGRTIFVYVLSFAVGISFVYLLRTVFSRG